MHVFDFRLSRAASAVHFLSAVRCRKSCAFFDFAFGSRKCCVFYFLHRKQEMLRVFLIRALSEAGNAVQLLICFTESETCCVFCSSFVFV